MTLYDITEEYRMLISMADSSEPEDEQIFKDTLESIKGELEVKADGYAIVMQELKYGIETFQKEIDRLTAKRDNIQHHLDRMKEAIRDAMIEMDTPEIITEHHKLKICNNGGAEPMKITGDVPDNYQMVIYKPDNDKIRKDLKEGKELGFAHLEPRGKHVRIS